MILAVLIDKFRTRGPLGFASDAAELAIACAVVGVISGAMYAGAIGGVVVAAPFVAAEWIGGKECRCVNSFDECRCGR